MFHHIMSLCIVGMILPITQAEVSAPAHLSAVIGHAVTLSCTVTVAAGARIRQGRWLDGRGLALIVYEPTVDDPRVPARIISRQGHVELARDTHREAITLPQVVGGDEGCYRCVFDIFPSGTQESTTCLSVTAHASTDGNKTAVSGKMATLSCSFGLPEQVRQVLWRKTAEQGDATNVASYSRHGPPLVLGPFRGRVALNSSLGDSHLTIQPIQTEDEGCYTCEFHTFPEGTKSTATCLLVYVLPKPEVSYITTSSGVVEANCTAASRPAANITWNVEGDERTLGPAFASSNQQGDGTTLVTSTLLLQPELLRELTVQCLVHHPGLDQPLEMSLKTGVSHTMLALILVGVVATVLLLILCFMIGRCSRCCSEGVH